MREELVKLILERLDRDADVIRADFAADREIKTRFCAIDDLLPAELANRISRSLSAFERNAAAGQLSREKVYVEIAR